MNIQVCLCGAQPSYPHARDCPYPLYFDTPALVSKWEAARAQLRSQSQPERSPAPAGQPKKS